MDGVDSDTTMRVGATASRIDAPSVASGRTIGRYVVLEEIGRGSMGAVYAAFDPELDRKVAIKLLHADAVSGAAREALLHEAQAIAGISHPNVVAVHDVGMFEGRVFMAMELLAGGTLRSFVERTRPSWRVIVQCFIAAGRGLVAAHALGMVHRDFKPDNVFIGEAGTGSAAARIPSHIRVGDFGLARAEGGAPPITERRGPQMPVGSVQTQGDSIAGSPAYMSPEQYDSTELDARSDQYSFCVALYELLYGYRPFRGPGTAEVRALKRQGRIAAVPADTDVPGWVRRAIERGLSPAREDRHPSMAALVQLLEVDPAQRRRRRLLFAGAAGVVVAGAALAGPLHDGGVASCTDGAQKLVGVWDEGSIAEVRSSLARADEALSTDAALRVEQVVGSYADAWRAGHRDACEATRVRGEQSELVLDRRMACLDDRLRDLRALVDVYRDADRGVAVRALDAAHALPSVAACADVDALGDRSIVPAPGERAEIDALHDRLAHARALLVTGRARDASAEAETILQDARAVAHPPVLADALFLRGRCAEQSGQFIAGKRDYNEAMEVATAAEYDELAARAAIALVSASARSAALDEAATALRFAQSAVDRIGNPPELTLALLDSIGTLRAIEGDYEAALSSHRRALAIEEAAESPQPVDIAHHWQAIANVDQARGELDAALAALTRVHEIRIDAFGPEHPALADVASQTGNVLRRQGRLTEAQASIERALEIRIAVFGEQSTPVAESLNELAAVLTNRDRWDEARAQFERARAIWVQVLGPNHPAVANALNNLAMCEHHRHDLDASAAYMDQAYQIYVTTYGDKHPLIAVALGNMAELAQERGDVERAALLAERAVTMFRAIDSGKSSYFPSVLALLGDLERTRGHAEQAQAAYTEVLAIAERTGGVDAATFTKAWCNTPVAARPVSERGAAVSCTVPRVDPVGAGTRTRARR